MTSRVRLVARDETAASDAFAKAIVLEANGLVPAIDDWVEMGAFGIADAEAIAASDDRPTLLVLQDTQLLRNGRVRSPEAFLKVQGILSGAGVDLLSLDDPILDTRRSDFVAAVRWATELRSRGISEGTAAWHAAEREQGRRARWPKCSACGHKVVRASNKGGGHNLSKQTGRPGTCSVEGCICRAMGDARPPCYEPVNEKLVGKTR